MNYKIKFLVILFIISINFIYIQKADAKIEDRIVAVVGTKIITKYDLESKIKMIAFLNNKNFAELNRDDFRKEILNNLVDEILISEQTTKLGITVSEEEFTNELAGFLQQTHISQEQLIQAINKGIFSKITLSNFVKHQVLMNKLIKEKLVNELQYSNKEKASFISKTKEKLKYASSDYKIILLNKANVVKTDKNFDSCTSLENFIQENKLKIISNSIIKSKDINKELLQKILEINKRFGFVEYNNLSVGFCLENIKSNNNAISAQQLENIFKNDLLMKAVKKNLEELRQNNYILIKN